MTNKDAAITANADDDFVICLIDNCFVCYVSITHNLPSNYPMTGMTKTAIVLFCSVKRE